jgi:hypothetical protein
MTASHPELTQKPRYEATDAPARPIWIVAASLVVSVVFVVGSVTLFFRELHRRDLARQQQSRVDRVTDAVAATRPHFPEPRLQVDPKRDLAVLRAREDTELQSYGWIDKHAGVVRLPIDRAMDLLVQRGLPVQGEPNAPKPTLTPLDMQQTRPWQRQPASTTPLQEVK